MSPLQQRIYNEIKLRAKERIQMKDLAESLGMTKGHLEVALSHMAKKGVLKKTRPTLAQRIKLNKV
tara:strand:- start:1064 stop:1261 length:198 start_codon:yes stop_codon:yes gene_type:complete